MATKAALAVAEEWPAFMPPCPKSWSEQYVDNVIRSTIETGAPKRRRRTTLSRKTVNTSFTIEHEHYDDFIRFFHITLWDGVKPFKFKNPMTNQEDVFWFTAPPSITASNKVVFSVSCAWVSDYD